MTYLVGNLAQLRMNEGGLLALERWNAFAGSHGRRGENFNDAAY